MAQTNGASTNGASLEHLIPKQRGLYYDGAFHDHKDGELKEIVSPIDGKVITSISFAGAEDTVRALEAAENAFESWAAVPTLEKCALVRKAAQVIRDHADELAMLDAWNIGSPVSIMRAEVEYAAINLDLFAGFAPAVTGDTHRLNEDMFHYTVHEPLGVVARVVAYNHPLLMVVVKLITPILVGNTVVLKAAEQAPLSALRAIELIGPIFPKGVVNVLAGGIACGQTLSSHPIVKKITLVGSAPIGRLIAKSSAETLKLNVFELGGKNALVAYPDADIPKLVDGIVAGMNWGWCGQSCSSTTRVFLHESLHDKVLELAVEKINSTHKPGNPLDPKTTMGTLVDLRAVARVKKYIEIGKSEGATLVTGGHAPEGATENTCQMLPTIFSNVKSEMRIAQEEIFGPVMCVLKWSDESKLWKDVNSVEYGLTGAVYSANLTTAQKAVKKMEAGYIWVNTSSHHYPGIPFGGYKQSGKGREHSLAELYDMTQVKAVHVSLQ